jgi:hypothetical protein
MIGLETAFGERVEQAGNQGQIEAERWVPSRELSMAQAVVAENPCTLYASDNCVER